MGQVEAGLDVVLTVLGREYPAIDERTRVRLSPPGLAGTFLPGQVVGFASLLLGMTALVLLTSCVNLAGLLLARASDRRKEIAICLALSLAGGAAGLVLAGRLMEGVALGTTVLFGMAPALQATRGDLASGLKKAAGRGGRRWAMREVVVGLLAGSVLVLRSLRLRARRAPGV